MNTLTIDGQEIEAQPGESVLGAARRLGIDIPALCHLEKCGPLNTCLVCLVKVVANGQSKLVPSCGTKALPGMVIESETEEVHEARRTALELLLSDHIGDCLSPCQRLCPLQLNIPALLRQVQSGKLEEAMAGARATLPLTGALGRLCHHPCEQGCRRGNWDSPAAIRDMEHYLTTRLEPAVAFRPPSCKRPSQRMVVVVGAGPTGLAAAFYLAKEGHAVTVIDRRTRAGGTLRDVPEAELPAAVLDAEIDVLVRMGIEVRTGIELGDQVTVEGLTRGFDAILLALGDLAKGAGEKLGLPIAGTAIRTDPNNCQTELPKVFAAGAAVKPIKQLVRAMSEGRAAAECIHQFLTGGPVRRPEKAFSSVMGRIDPGELRQFLRQAGAAARVTPCDRCAGFNRHEAVTEAERCLHCDCRSSGNCALQHYAQVYGADANRFKSTRRPFQQEVQPGGVIFEPGKCILCGICVKLTEMARERLGLTYIGRGFEVRVAAPFQHDIAEGLGNVAAECVTHCPTGALSFSEKQRPT